MLSRRFQKLLVLLLWAALLQPALAGWFEEPLDLKVPGVAFNLNPDYGTAAVYFPNGTFVTVAQVEGSPAYKQFMRATITDESVPRQGSFCHMIPSSLRHHFNSCNPSQAVSSTESLLGSLKASVASYFGTSFCFADLVLPEPERNGGYQRDIVQQSLKNIGLRQAGKIVDSGRAAFYMTASSYSGTEDPLSVLAIDYGRSGLNAMLFCDYDSIPETKRHQYVIELDGTDSESNQSENRRLEKVEEVLRNISRSPLGPCWPDNTLPDRVQKLILYGDMAEDPEFLVILGNIFGVDKVQGAVVPEPGFAAAIIGAEISHNCQNEIDFCTPAAFGCRWWSKLYHPKEHKDL